jgi:type 1 glutamine amidotransferase
MHCYRTGTDDWFKFIGIQSTGHGAQLPIEITFADTAHPVTNGLSNWTTIKEELYNNVKIFDSAHALARGKQADQDVVVVWTNDYGKTRVFNTTIGHNNETVADGRYLDLVTRGLLWACDKLGPDGKPKAGFGK